MKFISNQLFSMNRQLLIELKRMKDLQHDHLVRFVGACLDHSQPFLVTEYCPRGSLQDTAANEPSRNFIVAGGGSTRAFNNAL